jgi:hypothetical protein
MSCWVVPSLAADVWRIPLDQVWRRIRAGEIPTLQENGFTFVDVAPYGPRVERPILPITERPSTFEPAGEDVDAAGPAPDMSDEEAAVLALVEPPEDCPSDSTDEDEMGPADETASEDLGDWRTARRRNARLRVPPLKWRLTA